MAALLRLGRLGRRAASYQFVHEEASSAGCRTVSISPYPTPTSLRPGGMMSRNPWLFVKAVHTQSPWFTLSGSLRRTDSMKVSGRLFSSYRKQKSGIWLPASAVKESRFDQLKMSVKNKWEGLPERAQGAIYDVLARSVFLIISGGGGLFYLRTNWRKLDKLEEELSETKKTVAELKAHVARRDDVFAKYRDEAELRCERLELEVRELRFLKDLWMSTSYQKSSKAETEESE